MFLLQQWQGWMGCKEPQQPRGMDESGEVVKSMVFAIGWKGEVWADLEQAQIHKHQHQI